MKYKMEKRWTYKRASQKGVTEYYQTNNCDKNVDEGITKMLKFKLTLKLKQYKLFGRFNAIIKLRYVPLNKWRFQKA